ncbi:MAG: organic solvent tolerance protein OstA [Caulobacteraceae bacterium]|nr:organic solvent tolerance protein OstA [Caulobacteraceae bacterium]
MNSRRRTPSAAAKRALMAGAALAVLWSGAALAQPAPATPAAVSADGLADGEMYMEADELIHDDKAKLTTAKGSVEIRYEGRTLRADRVVYDQGPGVIRAYGNVQIINDDGTVENADEFTLDDKMAAGVALGFSARLGQNIKLAGASAVRRNANIQELNRAIYTPCDVCAKDGSGKAPTWSISADRVVQDKAKRIVYYRNARIRVMGLPVLYLPVFWHADPQAKRSSGFLTPNISGSDRRGFSYEQPYLWVISPSADLILSPQINTKVNPFLNGELRKRFYSGQVDFRFGYTHDKDFDGNGRKFGQSTSRSYILGRGAFQIDDKWRWGFSAERASDDLIFDKYEVGKVYESRGPYVADDRRLISQVYAVRQEQQSYFSVAAMTVQGLRPGDIDRTFPVIGPLIEGRYEPKTFLLGGRLRANVSAVALDRDQSTLTPELRLPGLDSRRVTGELDWKRSITTGGGLRIEPYADVRADAYSLGDVLTGTGAATRSKSVSRALAVAGAEVSYPVYRRFNTSTVVLEPLAQIALSPNAKRVVVGADATGQPIYLNEDSVAFEFDETTLFRANKFPGYDLYEDGLRANVAGRASVLWDDGRRASFLLGRSFRTEDNDIFSARTGLRQKASDWIVAADAQPRPGLSLFARARLDSDDMAIHRLETGANISMKRGSGFVRYLTDDFDINGVRRENLDLGGEVMVTNNWGLTAYGNRDIAQNAWVIRDVGVFYKDECLRVDVVYRREDTIIGRLGPSESVSVRLTLATLGGPLYAR